MSGENLTFLYVGLTVLLCFIGASRAIQAASGSDHAGDFAALDAAPSPNPCADGKSERNVQEVADISGKWDSNINLQFTITKTGDHFPCVDSNGVSSTVKLQGGGRVAFSAGGNIEVFDDFVQEEAKKKPFGLSLEVMSHLSQNCGTELNRVLKQIETNPEAAANVPGSSENIQAEIYHSVKEEMAQKLADVVFRRTNLGSGGNPGDEGLQACAAIMAKLLDWNELRTTKEIEEVKNRYSTP